jgi:hypothetical protein
LQLKQLYKQHFSVCAVTNRGSCLVSISLFDTIEDQYSQNRKKLRAMLKDIADEGFQAETMYSKVVDRPNDIWELKAGKLRLLYFKGDHPNIIICTDLHVKHSRLVDPQAVDHAVRCRNNYLRAYKNKDLDII